jgi:hypothetical protein
MTRYKQDLVNKPLIWEEVSDDYIPKNGEIVNNQSKFAVYPIKSFAELEARIAALEKRLDVVEHNINIIVELLKHAKSQ